MATRADVSDLRRFVDKRLAAAGFTKGRAGRNNEVVLCSWRRLVGGRLGVLELNDWDPWGEGRLSASHVDVAEAESWWASRDPMSAPRMTAGDVDLAIQRGVEGTTRELSLTPDTTVWQRHAVDLIDWVQAAL
jgi:hypothetical protein